MSRSVNIKDIDYDNGNTNDIVVTKHAQTIKSMAKKELESDIEWHKMTEEQKENFMLSREKVKFDEKYCSMLVEWMASGRSYETFGNTIGVVSRTLYEWEAQHNIWYQSKKLAWQKSLQFWEDTLISATNDTLKSNAALLIFKLKNAFPNLYSDRAEMKITGNNTIFVVETGITRVKPDVVVDAEVIDDSDLL